MKEGIMEGKRDAERNKKGLNGKNRDRKEHSVKVFR
jgi:hypothetical protein